MSAVFSPEQLAALRALLVTPELPELGPGPRAGVEPARALQLELDTLLDSTASAAPARELVRAVVLLWHDHLDESHAISQGIATPDGSFLHGIMHRREPDYGNAKYWFHRVGRHAAFPRIAGRVGALPAARDESLIRKLLPSGAWAPIAFIDACAECELRSGAASQKIFLQAVQRIECEAFLEHVCGV